MAIYLCFLFASAAEVFKKAIKSLICDGRDRARMDIRKDYLLRLFTNLKNIKVRLPQSVQWINLHLPSCGPGVEFQLSKTLFMVCLV